MQALIITHLSWSNHLARGSFWGALWIHTRWGRHSGSVGFCTVTQPPPPFTNGHTFCFSGMLQPKLKQGPQELPPSLLPEVWIRGLTLLEMGWQLPQSSFSSALLWLRHSRGSWAFPLPPTLPSSLHSLRGRKSLCLCSFVSSFALLICTRFPFVCWSVFCSPL